MILMAKKGPDYCLQVDLMTSVYSQSAIDKGREDVQSWPLG